MVPSIALIVSCLSVHLQHSLWLIVASPYSPAFDEIVSLQPSYENRTPTLGSPFARVGIFPSGQLGCLGTVKERQFWDEKKPFCVKVLRRTPTLRVWIVEGLKRNMEKQDVLMLGKVILLE